MATEYQLTADQQEVLKNLCKRALPAKTAEQVEEIRQAASELPRRLRETVIKSIGTFVVTGKVVLAEAVHVLEVLFKHEGTALNYVVQLCRASNFKMETYGVRQILDLYHHVQRVCREASPENREAHLFLEVYLLNKTRGVDRIGVREARDKREADVMREQEVRAFRSAVGQLAIDIKPATPEQIIEEIGQRERLRNAAFQSVRELAADDGPLATLLSQYIDESGNATGNTMFEQACLFRNELEDLYNCRRQLYGRMYGRFDQLHAGHSAGEDGDLEVDREDDVRVCEIKEEINNLNQQIADLRVRLSTLRGMQPDYNRFTFGAAEVQLPAVFDYIDELVVADTLINHAVDALEHPQTDNGFDPDQAYLDREMRLLMAKCLRDDDDPVLDEHALTMEEAS